MFTQEEVFELTLKEIARDARQAAEERCDRFYAELTKCLEPLGRIDDLLVALSDKEKMEALAYEFGLEIWW